MVRFSKGLPISIRRAGGEVSSPSSFPIPKSRRVSTLQFMIRHPQHILKRRRSSWEVLGIPPRTMRQRGGNTYNTFTRHAKKALLHVPGHELGKLSVTDLQKHPRIRELYEHQFKANPELINYRSIVNAVASNLLNYDGSIGAVRDSKADVRKKREMPSSIIPQLQATREYEFDRLLALSLDPVLAHRSVPALFLKSTYFTLRPHLLQAYQDQPGTFRGLLDSTINDVGVQVWQDYTALVNETNRIYLSRYPFQEVTLRDITPAAASASLSGYRRKLNLIVQLSRTIPGSSNKFDGLEDLTQTYARSPDAKLVTLNHFMSGLQGAMTNDMDFVFSVLRNNSRSHNKVITILRGNSL